MKDDTDGGNYGGLAFSYDSNVVRLWAPSKNLTSDKGRLIMVQDGWGREINSQASNKGKVRKTIYVYISLILYKGESCCMDQLQGKRGFSI